MSQLSEKTVIGIYLQITIGVLALALLFQRPGNHEGFQVKLSTVPTVKCVESGNTGCRFIDNDTSKTSVIVREQTNTELVYSCPKPIFTKSDGTQEEIIYTFNPKASPKTCTAPSGTDPAKISLLGPTVPVDESKITCGYGEEYVPALSKCSKIIGTIPKCISDTDTPDKEEVKKAMLCYKNRYPDLETKFKDDIALLLNHYLTIGRYQTLNPCCDETVSATPSGYINLPLLGQVEKNTNFWILFWTLATLLFIGLYLGLR